MPEAISSRDRSLSATPARQPKRQRDPVRTRAKILAAAKSVFAQVGLGGAKIEAIAEVAEINKRMIYEYFVSKDQLFLAVLEEAWTDIRTAESKLDLDSLEPREALRALMTFTWNFYLENPEFISLVNSENLHRARHIKESEVFRQLHSGFISMVQRILDRGVGEGIFRPGVSARQLHITLAAIGFYYLNNRFTGEVIFGFDFMTKEALAERLEFNISTIMAILRPD